MIITRILIQKHTSYLEIMLGLCRKSYLVDNSSTWSNYQCFFWVMTEKKNVLAIIVVICDLLYPRKFWADDTVPKNVIHAEKRT